MAKERLSLSARIIIGIYLFAAPLLLMIADILHYREHFVLSVIVFKLALVAFVMGSFGLAYIFPPGAKYFGLAGSGLIVLGAITLAAISTADLYNTLLDKGGFGTVQTAQMHSILQNQNGMRAVFLPTGFAFPIGLFILAVGIFRSNLTPKYIAYILCTGALLFTVARFLNMLPYLLLSETILFLASASTGLHIIWLHPERKK